jgi:hypothetical protein
VVNGESIKSEENIWVNIGSKTAQHRMQEKGDFTTQKEKSLILHLTPQDKEKYTKLLEQTIKLIVPQFIDSDTTSEILVELNNISNLTLTDITFDISKLDEDFKVTGSVAVKTLNPGKALEQRIKIKPRYEKGTFPIKIVIWGNGVSIEKEYTIKVGGTEIY